MTHGSLFSGIGGFDLAADWCGWKNIFQVEKDRFCRKILRKNFPQVKQFSDIFKFDGKQYAGQIDVISGGFPCQPFSIAGKRRGENDDRYLWDQMLRVITEIKPDWIVGENVPGIISMALDKVLTDLEDADYTTGTIIIPACAINAPHRRDRVWILANAKCMRRDRRSESEYSEANRQQLHQNFKENRGTLRSKVERRDHGFRQFDELPVEAARRICNVDDGLSGGLVFKRNNTRVIHAGGNTIVPDIAFEIFNNIALLSNA